MTTRKNTLERSRLAKGMRLSGLPLAAVAERLDCSVRTARRYSRMDLSEDYEEDSFGVSGANAEERQLFLKKGWPLLLQMIDTLETRVAEDSISTRDLTGAINTLSDRLTKFAPQSFAETEETQCVIHFVTDPAPGKDFVDAPENERALESAQDGLDGDGEG